MKKLVSIMMLAVVLLCACTSEQEKKNQALNQAGSLTVSNLISGLQNAIGQVQSAKTPCDPQVVLKDVLTPELIKEMNTNSAYKLTDKERDLLVESMGNLFDAMKAQYDTLPGGKDVVGLLKMMETTATENIAKSQTLGDFFAPVASPASTATVTKPEGNKE